AKFARHPLYVVEKQPGVISESQEVFETRWRQSPRAAVCATMFARGRQAINRLPHGQDCALADSGDTVKMHAATLLVREGDQGRGKTGSERQSDVAVAPQRDRYRPLPIRRRAFNLMSILVGIARIVGRVGDIL